MARLSFECQDANGDRVIIQSSEQEFDDILRNYEALKQLLTDAGFTILKAGRSSGYTRKKQEKLTFDGKTCPKCGSEMWDNRARNAESGRRGPDFRCKNADCSGATTDKNGNRWPFSLWQGQYEIAE